MTARGDEPLGSAAAPGAGREARASESSPPAAPPPLLPVGGARSGELPPPEDSSSSPKLHPSDFKRSTSVAPSEGGSSEGSSSGVSPHFPYDAQKDVVLRLEFLGPREVKARGWQLGAKRVRGPVQSTIAAPGRRPSPACPCARPPQAIIRAVRVAVLVGLAMLIVALWLKIDQVRCTPQPQAGPHPTSHSLCTFCTPSQLLLSPAPTPLY